MDKVFFPVKAGLYLSIVFCLPILLGNEPVQLWILDLPLVLVLHVFLSPLDLALLLHLLSVVVSDPLD